MIRPRCFLGLSFAASWLSLPLFYYLPGNPDKRQNGFDRFGRVADWTWKTDGGTVQDGYAYGYDRNSNRLWRENKLPSASNKDEYYGYDGLNRLTKFNRGTLAGEPPSIADPNAVLNQAWPELEALGNWRQFKWDPNGGGDSWTVQSRTHNKVNETLTVSGTGADWPDPNYDAAGNMIDGPYPVTCATQLHFTYDAWNRLMGMTCEGWGDYSYRYDGLHRRIRKISEEWAMDYYHNNSWQVLEIRQDQEPNAYEQYVWGANYIDAPVIRWHDGNLDGDLNDQGDNTLYYTYDGNFNVSALVEPDGDVVERYDYDPYGSGPGYGSYANQILFCGYRRDETGLYHVRNRYYHPRLGRWMSRDPIGYVDGLSLYCYAGNRPVQETDPYGFQAGIGPPPAFFPPHPVMGPGQPGELCKITYSAEVCTKWRHVYDEYGGFGACLQGCFLQLQQALGLVNVPIVGVFVYVGGPMGPIALWGGEVGACAVYCNGRTSCEKTETKCFGTRLGVVDLYGNCRPIP